MQTRLTIVMESGTESPEQTRKLAELLQKFIPQWLANDMDFEDQAVETTGNDAMFEEDFSVNVYYSSTT